jgi:DNA-binding NtrC family response regulator
MSQFSEQAMSNLTQPRAGNPMRKIVVIDDERPILMTLEALLRRHGYEPLLANTAAAGLTAIQQKGADLVLLDLGLPDADGLETLAKIKELHPQLPVIIVTAQDSLNNAIESIKLGAFHFISKPYAAEELMSLADRALEQGTLIRETEKLRAQKEQLSKRLQAAEQQLAPVFKSRVMRDLEDLIKRVAPTDANVLLMGESGVGKEVVANQIHQLSARNRGPLIKLNCAAFPHNMIEAELFGYVKGAFTGALNDFPGMIQESAGGSLFLDEIAEMPPELQTRFLRVLQEREFRPLGSTRTIKADFRLVAATNRPVAEAVSEGALRRDLYYRINTFQIAIPPLRERKEDIAPLVGLFAKRFATQMNKPEPQITPEAFRTLLDYAWPGNVRELQNAIEYSLVLAEDGTITERDMPAELQLPPALQNVKSASKANGDQTLEEQEKSAILRALAQAHGNKKKAAELLGIHRPTLYSKMKRLAIEV